MKQTSRVWIAALCALSTLGSATLVSSIAAPAKKPAAKKPVKKAATKKPMTNLVALKLDLPRPAFIGTPKNIPPGTTVEKPTGKPRPALYVPKGTILLSRGKPVELSDPAPIIGDAAYITDGNKEAGDGGFVELSFGKQYVQVDLERKAAINAIVIWYDHAVQTVYRDVVVQVSDDKDFVSGVTTVFNNDQDNSSGAGRGKDREFFALAEGKLISVKGVKGRYVRVYSRGSTGADENRFTEVEVWGK
jgi:hypothetical protein